MLYIALKEGIYIKLNIVMASLMVATLICSVCIVNRECKEWERFVYGNSEDIGIAEPEMEQDESSIVQSEETVSTETTSDAEIETPIESDFEVPKEEPVENSPNYSNQNVPNNNSIKSYMDYRRITSRNSKQYLLQHSLAYTGNYGIRMVGNRYCVAVGSYYTTTIGQYIDIELENGNVIQGILADCKDDAHTDPTNRINPNGSVVEFVVDTRTLDKTAKKMGDISYVNDWNSKVVNIKVYDFVEEF